MDKRIRDLDLQLILNTALSSGGDYADLYFEEKESTSITYEDRQIERVITGKDAGVGLRVIYDNHTLYAYTNSMEENDLVTLADKVSEAIKSRPGKVETSLTLEPRIQFLEIKRPFSNRSLKEKVGLVMDASKVAWEFDSRIVQVKTAYMEYTQRICCVNSLGKIIEDERMGLIFFVQVVSGDGKIFQTGYEPIGGFIGLEVFDDDPPEEVSVRACKRAILMLEADPAPAGQMPIIISSSAGGTMIHEAVGHGLEADLAGEGLSVYTGKIGEKVASSKITVIDDPTLPNKRGSYHIDDEGTPSKRNVLIENGILKSYLTDRLSSMKYDLSLTGNGRRESYRFKPIPRMSNTLIAPGEDDPDAILHETPNGLYVVKMGGGQVNTINGDFVFEVTEGYLIRNGEIGPPVRGATLIGNGPKVLKDIDRVGSDLGFGIGTCGKNGQGVPVADAQPTLRIPEIVVGGQHGEK